MLHFLSRFSLATRIYIGFLFLGIYVVSVCFASIFAVGYIHREYAKTDNIIENTRQFSVLENSLFTLKRSLYFFSLKGSEDEKVAVEEAFNAFEEKSKEIENSLEIPEVREKYQQILSASLEKYRTDMTKMFSLHEKSIEATEKVNKLAEKASEQLNELIEETTLPSASFALNGLREQLDATLRSIDAVSADNAESEKQLNTEFASLKKAQNTAKQAEMINTKQLKALFLTFNLLEEEINRKLRIDKTLREKITEISSVNEKNIQDLKDILGIIARSTTQLLSQADAGKIALQKAFVFAAGLGGVLAVLSAFLALFGVRYPLARLIENAQAMARGERSVQIHFTERSDEVGALAKSLTALLAQLKETPFLAGELLRSHQNVTFGSDFAYKNNENKIEETPNDPNTGEEFAYFGQEVGVDTESQLNQMLFLVQYISNSATELTQNIKQHFLVCRDSLKEFSDLTKAVDDGVSSINEKLAENSLNALLSETNKLIETFSSSFDEFDEIQDLFSKQDSLLEIMLVQLQQLQSFVPKLTEWGQVAGELTGTIRSLTSETKILSLNASIEAAKSGESGKSFGAVALDMRQKTHQTAEAAERLTSHLNSIREEAVHFAETMNAVGFQTEEIRRYIQAIRPIQTKQVDQINTAFDFVENVNKEMGTCRENYEKIQLQASFLPERLQKTSQLEPQMEQQIKEIEDLLDKFNSSLPVYEEDKESKND
ncbi:MAG: HAMP domain-containing protein [Alphaproteobacteria bacterium]|nr:HAMP domain-containing protein [Alphaproteobacteria bacterium]MBO4643938.1 HAMP domain-containing protein [Alphaproteobacteria bacterium]